MAHTIHGKLTGRAAATQKGDDRDYIRSISYPVNLDEIRARLKQKETAAIARCVELEGKISFYAWYAGVDGSVSARVELIEKRIEGLETRERLVLVSNLPAAQSAQVGG